MTIRKSKRSISIVDILFAVFILGLGYSYLISGTVDSKVAWFGVFGGGFLWRTIR